MTLRTLDTLLKQNIKGKRVVVRADLNVPMHQGRVADDTRLRATMPTIQALNKAGAAVVVLSHFGRPDGKFDPNLSLGPIADHLSALLKKDVAFGVDCVGKMAEMALDRLKPGGVLLMENLRFHPEEKKNEAKFVKALASLGDYYVNDAFSCSHRKHASITGLGKALPSYAGKLLQKEVEQLDGALNNAKKPMAAIVGGAKISTKIDMLQTLVTKMDKLFVGGGMANTFLHAQGVDVGASLCEKDLKSTALSIIKAAEKAGCELYIPVDAVVADALEENAATQIVPVKKVPKQQMILDIGPQTVMDWSQALAECKTVVWNGPLGAFEIGPFDVGTTSIARQVASLTKHKKLNSVAGGGDVIAALARAGLRDGVSYISTAGGAFLEWLEGKTLPGVAVLMDSKTTKKTTSKTTKSRSKKKAA